MKNLNASLSNILQRLILQSQTTDFLEYGMFWEEWRSSQSILKEISPWCSLEGLMLKLKLQYSDSFENSVMLGKIEGRRRGGRQRMRWLDGITLTQWV